MSIQHHVHQKRSTRAERTGIVLATLLAVNDALLAPQQIGDGDPLVAVILACAIATAIAVPFAWRGSARGRNSVVATRVVSALTGVPAFFVSDVPAVGVVMAAVGIVLALLVAMLIYTGSRREP